MRPFLCGYKQYRIKVFDGQWYHRIWEVDLTLPLECLKIGEDFY